MEAWMAETYFASSVGFSNDATAGDGPDGGHGQMHPRLRRGSERPASQILESCYATECDPSSMNKEESSASHPFRGPLRRFVILAIRHGQPFSPRHPLCGSKCVGRITQEDFRDMSWFVGRRSVSRNIAFHQFEDVRVYRYPGNLEPRESRLTNTRAQVNLKAKRDVTAPCQSKANNALLGNEPNTGLPLGDAYSILRCTLPDLG